MMMGEGPISLSHLSTVWQVWLCSFLPSILLLYILTSQCID